MARKTIKKIADLADMGEGLIDKLFQAELERVTVDVIDRPGLATARKLVIELSLEPVMGQDGHIDSVNVACEVNGKVPKQKSAGYSMLCNKGALTFNDHSKDNPRQATLDELPPKGEGN